MMLSLLALVQEEAAHGGGDVSPFAVNFGCVLYASSVFSRMTTKSMSSGVLSFSGQRRAS